MGNLSVGECATKVYEAAREGSSDLTDLLKRLETTVQTKTALETKTKDGSHFVTPLIIAAHNGHPLSSAEASLYGGEAFVLRLGRKKKRARGALLIF